MLLDDDLLACYSAPSNLLLFGEYAILSRYGIGITAAIAPRITASISHAREFNIIGLVGGKVVKINSDTLLASKKSSLAVDKKPAPRSSEINFLCQLTHAILAILCRRQRAVDEIYNNLPYCITIDARACYDKKGNKIGLGSSAASAVSLSAALTHLIGAHFRSRWSMLARSFALSSTGKTPDAQHTPTVSRKDGAIRRMFQQHIFRLALHAHRYARGGSGYDVATSAFGGFLLFRGGRRPRAHSCILPWGKSELRLLRGSQAVDSKEAVSRYANWRGDHRWEWRQYIRKSNRIVRQLLTVQSEHEMVQLINASRELQISIGEHIGVTAQFALPADGRNDYPRVLYRTVGAGNELAVVFGAARAVGNDAGNTNSGKNSNTSRRHSTSSGLSYGTPLLVERDGIRWEADQ